MENEYSGSQGKDGMGETRGGISGSTVKLVGIITMLIDHFAAAVLARILIRMSLSGEWSEPLYFTYNCLRMVGRLGFPIFCFLLVEGFGKTRSRKKYALRLGMFALISEVPFDLAFNAEVLEFGYQNVYFTLFLGMLTLCTYEFLAGHRLPAAVEWVLCAAGAVLFGYFLKQQFLPQIHFEREEIRRLVFPAVCLWVFLLLVIYGWRAGWDKMRRVGTNLTALSLFMLLADFMKTDYSGMGVLTITVIYILRSSNVLAMAGGCVVLTFTALNELPAFFTLIPIAGYNGKRGLKLKYFFYVFYPAHLLLLWLAAYFMGLASISVVG